VHDEAGISFHFGCVFPIVMNSVAIKRQGRVTKKHHRIRLDFSCPCSGAGKYLGFLDSTACARVAPIDDVVLLDHSQAFANFYFMPNNNKDQGSSASFFVTYISDGRGSGNVISHAEWAMKLHAVTSKHSSRERHGRKEAAPLDMAIAGNFRMPMQRQKIKPAPKRWQRVAGFGKRIISIESGGKSGYRYGRDLIRDRLSFSYPFPQVIYIQFHGVIRLQKKITGRNLN